jgi:hypothetical protein
MTKKDDLYDEDMYEEEQLAQDQMDTFFDHLADIVAKGGRACGACMYFEPQGPPAKLPMDSPDEVNVDRIIYYGECRRNTPICSGLIGMYEAEDSAVWPVVPWKKWCGEFWPNPQLRDEE